jgi:hypothetical protein
MVSVVTYVYMLQVWTPHDGSEVIGVFSSQELAQEAADRYRHTAEHAHENIDIQKIKIDGSCDYYTKG